MTTIALHQRVELAHAAEQFVLKRARAATYAFLMYGAALYEFETERHWVYLPDPLVSQSDGLTPFRSFDKWLRSRKELNYSMARLALQVWKRFVVDLGIPKTDLAAVDVSKFQDITPEVQRLVENADTPEALIEARQRALEWVASGSDLSRKDLQDLRGDYGGWETIASGEMTVSGLLAKLANGDLKSTDVIYARITRKTGG